MIRRNSIAAVVVLTLASSMGARGDEKVLIDFGAGGTQTISDGLGRIWNNVTDGNDLSGQFTLFETGGFDSGVRLTITNPPGTTNPAGFNGSNTNGIGSGMTGSATGDALARSYPVTATQDSLFGNTRGVFGVGIVEAVRLVISDLDPNETYGFDFFASRMGVTDNRETEYLITGGLGGTGPTSVFVNASGNTGTIVGATGFRPDENNQIIIDIDAGPNNSTTTPNGFYYLGVMEINIASVPEPATAGALAFGVALLLNRRRRV